MAEQSFMMGDNEIAASFRTAASPHKQVQVLADLNCVSKYDMEVKLFQLGLLDSQPQEPVADEPPKRPRAPRPRMPKRWDEARAMSLYNEGATDLDIADSVGVTKTTIASWRRGQGLPPNVKPAPSLCTGSPPPVRGMTVQRLQRLLDAIASGHPDALVFADGCSIIGVDVLVSMDPDGKTRSSRISLRTEE